MSKYFSLIVFLCFSLFSLSVVSAQDYNTQVLKDLKSYERSLVSKNFEKSLDYIYPNIILSAGGKKSMIDILSTESKSLKDLGIAVADYLPSDIIQTIDHKEEIHCIVPHQVTLRIGNNSFRGTEYVLGISTDQGSSWTFVELKSQDTKSLKKFVPLYSDEMHIPEIEDFVKLN